MASSVISRRPKPAAPLALKDIKGTFVAGSPLFADDDRLV